MPIHATARFGDRHSARAALEQLVQAGFSRDVVSVLMTEETYGREFQVAVPDGGDGSDIRAPSGGILAAMVPGLVEVGYPGGLALRARGPVLPTLLRTAAAPGTFAAALDAAGLADAQGRFIEEGVRSGSIVVAVHTRSDRARLATQLLELAGGTALVAA